MAQLIYAINMSLDGYVADRHGRFDFFPVDDQVFLAHTDLHRTVGTLLYGRRLYETMAVWETDPSLAAASPLTAAFAQVWTASTKVVYSRTLTVPATTNTRIEGRFDPDSVRALKESADQNLMIGGPELAAHALHAGLVDEVRLFVLPVTLGGGKPALPTGGRINLALRQKRRFRNGVVELAGRPASDPGAT